MQKFNCLFLFLTIASVSLGQSRFGISGFGPDSSNMAAGIYSEYHIGSTALTNRLYLDFLRGNYIERETLDKVSKRLVKFNKTGGDLQGGIFFSQKIDTLLGKSGFSYFVNIADRFHADALFTDDLFTMLFYGNKQFEGDTAEMGTFYGNYLHYQQIQLGIIKTNENQSVFGLGASYIRGQEFYEVNIARANLYTSPLGFTTTNELDLLYRTVESDPDKKSYRDMSGWGFAIDAFYQVPYHVLQDSPDEEEGDWKGFLRIEASDLGFIKWGDRSRTAFKDSSYTNNGILIIEEVITGEAEFENPSDSLQALVEPDFYRGGFSSVLPGIFHLKMYQENTSGLYITMGTILRLFANYSPLIYLGSGQKFSEKLHVGGILEFGGYGRFNIGVEAGMKFSGFELLLGSRGLGGMIFPKSAGSNSAFISLKKRI